MSWFKRITSRKDKSEQETQGVLQVDFTKTFPHVFWISGPVSDETERDFIYKVLTQRQEPEMTIEMMLIRQSQDGAKTIALQTRGDVSNFAAVEDAVADLAESFSTSFERFDFSTVRDFDAFAAKANELGWGVSESDDGKQE